MHFSRFFFVCLLSPQSPWNSLDHYFSFIFMLFSLSFLFLFQSFSSISFLSYELCRRAVKWKGTGIIYSIFWWHVVGMVLLFSVITPPHILNDAMEVHRSQFVSLLVRLRNFSRNVSSSTMVCEPSCGSSLIHNHVLRSGKSGTPFTL